MSYPKWITPEGNLGVVPEQEYYEFPLDAYDSSAGTLIFSLISGRLPLGLQIVNSGKIQGIPVSEAGGDQNVEYTFTVRVTNILDLGVADRTFSLTITNVGPPIISSPTRNSDLGIYFDGTEISLQLEAIEYTPGLDIVWSLRSGELPPGLSLSSSGLISGYILPIPSNIPGADPGWDDTPWSYLGWDFQLIPIRKTFTFTVEASDGVSSDLSTYTLEVFPKQSITADDNILTVDSTSDPSANIDLTADLGTKHAPIITTLQANIPPIRAGSFFSFNIDAIDLDDDIVNFSIPVLASGSFDEQAFSNVVISYPYVNQLVTGNTLETGVFPRVTSTVIESNVSTSVSDNTLVELEAGDIVKVLKNTTISGSSYDLWHLATVTSNTQVRLVGNTIISASAGDYLTQASSLANALISNVSATTGSISTAGSLLTGFIQTNGSLPIYNISLSGNIRANVGEFITQDGSSANATVTANVTTYMFLSSGITVAAGDFITQNSSNANARVSFSSSGSTQIYVDFLANTFTTGSGNISLVDGSNIANVTALDVYPVSTTTTANAITVLYTTGQFTQGSGNLKLNNAFFASNVYTTANAKIPNTITLAANIGDFITQPSTGANATVSANVTDAISIPVIFDSGVFNVNSGNIQINGSNVAVYPTEITQTTVRQTISANVGDYITQTYTGANAVVTANVVNVVKVPVTFLANSFTTGSGNLKINGANVKLYPSVVNCSTDISATYTDSNTFELNTTDVEASIQINSSNTNSYISTILSVGITVGALATEGTEGFDETKFDQGTLDLPTGLTINTTTGWITGQLPNQTANETVYDFEVLAYKRDNPTYQDSQLFYLTILGDMNNTINWITDENLGSIQNGKLSDLYIQAESSKGKTLTYSLKPGAYQNLPQGLRLLSGGLLSGRISFELFSLDSGATGIDENALGESTTTFDQTFEFTVTATDIDRTISADRTFRIKVINANKKPYENLYLKALPTQDQRTQFTNIVQDRNIFPLELVYRNEDPHFGLAKSIKTLFLPGLNPTTLADYVQAAETNHYMKRITFGEIKTAQALDNDFNVKYEVVYLEIKDDNTNADGQGPSDTLYPLIDTPYYDLNGNAFTVAYPNSFSNMRDIMVGELGYANKGVLPDWMTSKQTNDKVLGFVRAVVLGYTVPGASEKIAYRLREQDINFNTIDFTVDRYQLDNVYTENYDISANAFLTSEETTFDRYPGLSSSFNDQGSVNYAVSIAFDQINQNPVSAIQDLGGMDGVNDFQDGDTIVFAQQEFFLAQADIGDYNQGWSHIDTIWDGDPWDYDDTIVDNPYTTTYGYSVIPWTANITLAAGQITSYLGNVYVALQDFTAGATFSNTITSGSGTITVLAQETARSGPDITPGIGWDQADYVPGSREVGITSTYNERIGVWRINIDANDFVTLSFVRAVNFYDKLFVLNGRTYGRTNIYYDPVVKSGLTEANYSIIPQEIRVISTVFDGGGTRFASYRDEYVVPEQGDKYIKFTKTGVFT